MSYEFCFVLQYLVLVQFWVLYWDMADFSTNFKFQQLLNCVCLCVFDALAIVSCDLFFQKNRAGTIKLVFLLSYFMIFFRYLQKKQNFTFFEAINPRQVANVGTYLREIQCSVFFNFYIFISFHHILASICWFFASKFTWGK